MITCTRSGGNVTSHSETVVIDCPKCKGTGGTFIACDQCLGFGRVVVPFANRFDGDAHAEDVWHERYDGQDERA